MNVRTRTSGTQGAARRAADNPWLERAARVGYLVNGLLHILIGYIALQVAFASSGSGKKADQSGALALLAGKDWGRFMLWVCVAGLIGLALWQFTEAVFPRVEASADAKDRTMARLKAAAKGVVYAVLAYTAGTFAAGGGSSSTSKSADFTTSLMSKSGGRTMVVLIGLVVIGVGGYLMYKGFTKKFLEDLAGHPGTPVVVLGQVGYIAKGFALGTVGALFVAASLRHQPKQATGLDGALRTLRDQPFGTTLLTLIALGFAAYGIFSFVRARLARL